jgi:PAS domain S-box-containing protein
MIVKDIMTPVSSSLRPSDTLRSAIRFMKETRLNTIPVTDETHRLVGVITRSILFQMLLDGAALDTLVGSCMKQDVVACPFDTPYEVIVDLVKDSTVGTGIVVDQDRRVLGVFTKTDMITALFRSAQSLKEQLEAVLRSTHLGAVMTDQDGNILFVNEGFCSMLKTEEKELIGRSLHSVLPRHINTREMPGRSVRVQMGHVQTIMRSSPYVLINGQSGIICLFQDVSDLEEMAHELEMVKKWQKLLDTTIEHAYDGLVMVNEKGEISFLNPPMAELFGLNKEAVLGQPISTVLPQLELEKTLQTGSAEFSDIQEANGIRYLVQRIPVIQEEKIIGAIGKILFRQLREVRDVLRRMDMLESQVAYFKEQVKHANAARFTFEQIVTADPLMEKIKKTAAKAAKGRSTILLRGESGTGKELFAHAIHAASARKDGPFITVNCAAIPEHLLESEFFGYEPGAFTGAERRGKIGKFDLANGGTLFLDEIGDMSPGLQAKLLRVLQDSEFYRVGGTERIRVDVRIIAATNRSLEQMVENGEFREDLFYRLNVISLDIPPLRERKGDVLLLARHCIKELNAQLGTSITGIAPEAEEILLHYHWPGNVRELRNVMERAMTFAEHGKIQLLDLPDSMRRAVQTKRDCQQSEREHSVMKCKQDQDAFLLDRAVSITEWETIQRALDQCGGNKTRAAKMLGLSRSVLYEKIAKYKRLSTFR